MREYLSAWVPTDLEQHETILFDTEGDGLLRTTTQLHCMVTKNSITGEIISAREPEDMERAIDQVCNAKVVVAHNLIRHDAPVIEKLTGRKVKGRLFDTLIALQLIYGTGEEFRSFDFVNIRGKKYKLPPSLIGSHSLKAWGFRLGVLKDDFGDNADWSTWTPQMQEYCEQDVEVLWAMFKHITKVGFSPLAMGIEMAFAELIHKQEECGFPFDMEVGEKLYAELCAERSTMLLQLNETFPPKIEETIFIPKVNNKTRGYKKGVPFMKRKEIPFSPNSNPQVAERLQEAFGWEPEEYTPTGQPKVDGDTLRGLPYKEAQIIADYLEVAKIIGMVAEGKNGWFKMVTPLGRIHGSVNTLGTVTGRCSHSRPNLGQVPRKTELGLRCRECFVPPEGWYMVGADASGLELRMLGHFMARYDGGAYIETILRGDIHTVNQKAAGLPTRDMAKTFIYAFLYGAGDEKLGSIVHPTSSPAEQRKIGRQLRNRFLRSLPALKKLLDTIKGTAKKRKNNLKGIDKRNLKIRSLHSAPNTVLQSAGAVLVKLATIIWHLKIEQEAGYAFGDDWVQLAHVHDEVQGAGRTPEIAEEIGQLFCNSIELAGEFFEMRCETTGEYKLGKNWRETH